MHTIREPRLRTVAIADLRPTQMTVGLREVAAKQAQWQAEGAGRQADFLGTHMIPAVKGPKGRYYVIDHHHLCRALLDAGQTEIAVTEVADLSRLEKAPFFVYLDNRGWLHPYDAEGIRRGWEKLPKAIADLADDPYRSLAGALRRRGGFAKDITPFSEFIWADFLRRTVVYDSLDKHFDAALDKAFKLAKSRDADFLPGWCGPSEG
jgi:hypothetical protein